MVKMIQKSVLLLLFLKGRVKRIHIEEEFREAEVAAEALSLAVTEDFLPIISRIKATTAPLGGPKGEILYAREHEAVWFKGKRFMPSVWAGTPGEEQIRHLKPAIDSKGGKVGEEWFTTAKVEDALTRYHEAGAKEKAKVLELLRGLSSELQEKVNILVFASMLLIIAKALFAHGKRFMPSVWAGTPGEEQIRHLKPAIDSKGRKVGEEWFTTAKVEDALTRYHEAGAKAKAKVLELLRGLSSELQAKVNILVFASMLLIIAKALFAHVRLETNNFIYLFRITSQICTEFDVVFHVKLLV
ncbi:hypothetical protein FEM48_Zijuj07G0085400 [Ziziphus jujuba var. spinosa]|uniref:DNA mismatch repair protein MSH1, mitochondrial-like n=1 Tax=Ziziphus jujuba var. spinosa TaxID=714518 RepID=A0A978V3K7_ZIZJJ|nr:hypothetical protein FEM48_Zijuj07G0085400 [Ziziphus jujuba var. spinosa]